MSECLEEFVEEFNGAPFELADFAEGAAEIEDCEELSTAASDFLHAKEVFENALNTHGIEVG